MKWLLVRGVAGKLVSVPGEPGNYYGMKQKSFPSGDTPRLRSERYEPCEMVVPWSLDIERAARERKRGNGEGKLVDAKGLVILGRCKAPNRKAATEMLVGAMRGEA